MRISALLVAGVLFGLVLLEAQPTSAASLADKGDTVVCSSGAQLAAAVANTSVSTVLLSEDVTLYDDDYNGLTIPLLITRDFTVQSIENNTIMINFNYVIDKVQMASGVTLTLRNVVLYNFIVLVGPTQQFTLAWISASGAQPAAGDYSLPVLVLDSDFFVYRHTYSPDIHSLVLNSEQRPPEVPGQQAAIIPSPPPTDPASCTNDTSAPFLRRCLAYAMLFEDFAFYISSEAQGNTGSSQRYVVHDLNMTALVLDIFPAECIQALGPVGCSIWFETHSDNETALPWAAPGGGSSPSGSGGGGGAGQGSGVGAAEAQAGGRGTGVTVVLPVVLGVVGGLLVLAAVAVLLVRWARARGKLQNLHLPVCMTALVVAKSKDRRADPDGISPPQGVPPSSGKPAATPSYTKAAASTPASSVPGASLLFTNRRSGELARGETSSCELRTWQSQLDFHFLLEQQQQRMPEQAAFGSSAGGSSAVVSPRMALRRDVHLGVQITPAGKEYPWRPAAAARYSSSLTDRGGGHTPASLPQGPRGEAALERQARELLVPSAAADCPRQSTAPDCSSAASATATLDSKGLEAPPDTVVVVPDFLGRGAFGSVYRGVFRGLNVAVKVLEVPGVALGSGVGVGAGAQPSGSRSGTSRLQGGSGGARSAAVARPQQGAECSTSGSTAPAAVMPADCGKGDAELDASRPVKVTKEQQADRPSREQAESTQAENTAPEDTEPEGAQAGGTQPAEASQPEGAQAGDTQPAEASQPGHMLPASTESGGAQRERRVAAGSRQHPESSFGYQGTCDALRQLVAVQRSAEAQGVVEEARGRAARQAEMLAQEVKILGRCTHPNVVQLLAASLEPSRCCLVLELMETSLDRLLRGGPGGLLPLPKVLHIAEQVCQGLEYLHPSIVHRDLKPANVLLSGAHTPRPVVKLADFGLSRIRYETAPTLSPQAGTPAYSAPECLDLHNNIVSHRADIYSLGVLLWTMVAGQAPWQGLPMLAIACRVAQGDRPPLDPVPESRCPAGLRNLIRWCWERDPHRRPAAAEALRDIRMLQLQLQDQGADQP